MTEEAGAAAPTIEEKKPRTPFVYNPLTDDALKQLAVDIFEGRVFGTWSHPDAQRMSFIPLHFIDEETWKEMEALPIGHVYEYLSKANLHSVNGLPSFMSMNLLSVADSRRVREVITKLKAARDAALA